MSVIPDAVRPCIMHTDVHTNLTDVALIRFEPLIARVCGNQPELLKASYHKSQTTESYDD